MKYSRSISGKGARCLATADVLAVMLHVGHTIGLTKAIFRDIAED